MAEEWLNLQVGDNWIQLVDLESKEFKNSYGGTKYARDVYVGGKQMAVGLPRTANDKLKMNISTLQKANANPLEFTFNIRKNKTGPEIKDVSYEVVTGDRVATPTPKIAMFGMPTQQQKIILTRQEEEMLQEAVDYPEKLTEDNFIQGFVHSLKTHRNVVISRDRAKEVYTQHYLKRV